MELDVRTDFFGRGGLKILEAHEYLARVVRSQPDQCVIWLGDNDRIVDGRINSATDILTQLKMVLQPLKYHLPQCRFHVMGILPRVGQLNHNVWAASTNTCLFRSLPEENVVFHDQPGPLRLVRKRSRTGMNSALSAVPNHLFDDGGIHLIDDGYNILYHHIRTVLQHAG